MANKKNDNEGRFVYTFNCLKTNTAQEHILNEMFKQATSLYNDIQRQMLNTYKFIISHNAYKNAETRKEKNDFIKNFKIDVKSVRRGIISKSFNGDKGYIASLAVKYGANYPYISGTIAENLGVNAWASWEKKLWGNGKHIAFHSNENPIKSVTTRYMTSTKKLAGMDFDENVRNVIITVGKHKLTIPIISRGTEYDAYAIDLIKNHMFSNGTIVRKKIRGKIKYELQITLKGVPYNKMRKLGKGNVGVDIGMSMVATYGNKLSLDALSAENKREYQKELEVLERKMDRSRRATNPDNYDDKGRIVSKEKRMPWVYSKKYNVLNEAGFDYHYNSLSIPRKVLTVYGQVYPYIPIIGTLANIGLIFWIYLYMTAHLVINKQKKYIILMIPAFALIFSCLVGPVNTYFRYVLPYSITLPMLAILLFKNRKDINN
jgi:hypothetical protein